MANTFVKIASVTVGSGGAASIDFTSIPSTYTDLCIKVSARGSAAASYAATEINLNGSATGFTGKLIYGSGSAAASSNVTKNLADLNGSTSTANTFGSMEIYIPNYAGSTNKSMSVDGVSENNATEAYAELVASLWSNTAAINRVTLFISSTFLQYSTAVLYGIKNS